MVTSVERSLVNPIAIKNCVVRLGDVEARVLDISFIRAVVENVSGLSHWQPDEPIQIEFILDRYRFHALSSLKTRVDSWLRVGFDRIVPSARSHLRSFLSPKKIGESILEQNRVEPVRHYHGLNESELWFNPEEGVLFTYLDQNDFDAQFIVRLFDFKGPLQAGKILRTDYMQMKSWDDELKLSSLNDREVYSRLGECRDIVTNFRPTGELEYNLKQRLLKVMSDSLYSTNQRVEMSQYRISRSNRPPVSSEPPSTVG